MSMSAHQNFLDKQITLGESLIAEVVVAQDKKSKAKFLIKKIHPDFVNESVKNDLAQQLNHLHSLEIPELLIPELQLDSDNNLQLIQSCPVGQLLRDWLAERKEIEIGTVLEIAIALVNCVAVRHRAGLIHQAIKPNNILIQDNPVCIQLMDEVQIIDRKQLSQFVNNAHYRRETLPYSAPEMSGRIRTDVDYYSDLYSVGTVLYECLTGEPPFSSEASLSIVHSHLAEEAQPVRSLNDHCPEILSDIVAILLNKQPEKRYQTAIGLCVDLQTCLSKLKLSSTDKLRGEISAFPLQQQETMHQITIPSIMVGRAAEQQRLLDEYQRVCTGQFGIVMLSGLSGVGKTRLVQELELPIVAQQGYFISGKFNQFSSHLPYSTLTSAFSRLLRQILTEDTARIDHWRERFLDAVGVNGQLVTDLVPELEAIIGKQPDVQPMNTVDAKNRFNNLFSRTMACLATKEHPLVLFIDDLQWCDHATFDLLEVIFTQPENHPYLLIIGAYRHNEINEGHRVRAMESLIKESSQTLHKVHLDSLDELGTSEMVAYILDTNARRSQVLARTIYATAGGNPLYVSEILRWLHKNEHLYFSEEREWSWQNKALANTNLPSNITTLFVEKLTDFSTEVQDLLATAALLGAQFEATDLAKAAGISLSTLYADLVDVFEQRILRKGKKTLSFFHDQIQAAAAKFLNDEQQKQRHRVIARAYIEQIDTADQKDINAPIPATQLFSIVEHLAAGRTADASDDERFEEARFNYRAGIAAMTSLALQACNHYLTESVALCSDHIWDIDYEFMLLLQRNLARAATMNGDQNRANEIVQESLKHVKTDLDRAELLYEQSEALATLGDLAQAIALGSHALALLGDAIPVLEPEIQREIMNRQTELHENNRDIWQEVLDSPTATDRQDYLIHQLYGELIGCFYFSGDVQMTQLLVLRSIDFSVKKGADSYTCYALACMASLSLNDRDYSFVYKYESATLQLVKRYPNTFGAVKGMGSIEWATMSLTYPISEMRNYCYETALEGMRCGELRYGVLARNVEYWFTFTQGDNFPLLDSNLKKTVRFSKQFNLALPLAISEAIRFSLEPLLKDISPSNVNPLIAEKIQTWTDLSLFPAIPCYYTFSGAVAYYNEQYDEAELLLDQAEPLLIAVSPTIVEKVWFVFKYLVCLQKGLTEEADNYLTFLKECSSDGPLLKPYMALIEAETVAKKGEFGATRNQYLDAIDSANKEDYTLLEAFLNKRLYQHLAHNKHHSAEVYRKQANVLFQRCGVINRIESSGPIIIETIAGPSNLDTNQAQNIANNSRDIDEALDVSFLFAAVKTITSELDLNKLMAVILESVMAKLGAKTGYLLATENQQLQPLFKGVKNKAVTVISRDDNNFNTHNLCFAVANYAFNAKTKIVLNDAVNSGEFISDEVVQKYQLKSILCVPIVMKNQVLGVLYLENNLIDSVFTESQIAHADVLISQAAVALQNSKLLRDSIAAQQQIEQMNKNLESTIEKRTKELHKKQVELTHASRLASLGELATGIAHELGQPLQIIQTASRIIQDESASRTNELHEIIPFTNDILEQVERASAIIRNMRAYARHDQTNAVENIDLSVPLKQCLIFFVEQFHQHQIDLTVEIEEDLPKVLVTAQKFQQIVVNLLSNARHAVDEQFRLAADAKKQITVRLYAEPDNNNVFLAVQDNGIGMGEFALQRCLDPFYTTKEMTEGTGLGLSITHDLIEEFGFSLKIKSKPGEGSLFTIAMPVLAPLNTDGDNEV